MGGGSSKSDSDSKTKFNQNVWAEQIPALQNLFQQGASLLGGTLGQQQTLTPEVQQQMGGIFNQLVPAFGGQLSGGAYSGVDPNRIIGGIEQSLQQPSQTGQLYNQIMGGQGNVFLGGMEDILARQSADRQAQGLRGLDQRAAAAGMGGSSPYRNLQRNVISDEADRLAEQQTGLGYDTFGQDLGLKLGIAQQADQNQLARQQMLLDQIGNKQAAMTGGFGIGNQLYQMPMAQFAPTMMPWQAMGQYANIIGRPTILGSGVMRGDSSSKGLGLGI